MCLNTAGGWCWGDRGGSPAQKGSLHHGFIFHPPSVLLQRSLGDSDAECPICAPDFRRMLDIRRNMAASATQQVGPFFSPLRQQRPCCTPYCLTPPLPATGPLLHRAKGTWRRLHRGGGALWTRHHEPDCSGHPAGLRREGGREGAGLVHVVQSSVGAGSFISWESS